MAETDTKASSKRLLVALVVTIVVVGAFAAAYALLGGAGMIADLLGGTGAQPVTSKPTTPAKPSTPSSKPATSPAGTAEPTASAEPTSAAEQPATQPSGTTSGASTKPTVTLPTSDQAARMYWEQVASQEQIGKLVRGEVSRFSIGTVSVSGDTAIVPLSVSYTDGSSLSGRMVLRKYGNAWYFSSIARSGSPATVTTGKSADLGVVSTIVNQQATNQDLVAGIVSGAYKSCTINGVSAGSGTATVRITLSGGSGSPVAGRITCVSKVIDGTKMWFVTSFAKN
ncbi:MAG: hypothetical protein QMD96_00590 [Anaerosomatales bacterium]|nr:hypothetical protein [Anaerosomatales bacterium]